MKIEGIKIENKRVIQILELIKIELNNKLVGQTGICKTFYNLTNKDLVTYQERDLIKKFLLANKPTKRNKYKEFTDNKHWFNDTNSLQSYWWEMISLSPETREIRINYLNALIKNIK